MLGFETPESVTPVTAEGQDGGAETPRNPVGVRVAVVALVAATLATVAATAVMVISHPDPVRSEPVRPSASAPAAADSQPPTEPAFSIRRPSTRT